MRKTRGLETLVRQRERQLQEALDVYERNGNPETREVGLVDAARQMLDLAQRELQQHRDKLIKGERELRAEQEREWLRQMRAPPSLQALVERHGTWDRITPEAWKDFDADMARWRERLTSGYYQREATKRGRDYEHRR